MILFPIQIIAKVMRVSMISMDFSGRKYMVKKKPTTRGRLSITIATISTNLISFQSL